MWGEFKSLNDSGGEKKNGKLEWVEGTETECDI